MCSMLQALLFICGKGETAMKDFRGETNSEDRMIRAMQKAIGAQDNGWVGAQTMSDLAVAVSADCWPCTLRLYDMPVIIADDIIVCNPGMGCKNYANSISGSFSYQQKPCSILVNRGNVLCGSACHAWLDKPESVLYRLNDGTFGMKRAKYVGELPEGIRWAVGAMGLLDNYDPAAEGFSGAYADVLRKTNHTVLGTKRGMVHLVYCRNMTGQQVNDFCRNKLKLELAVMLDGGHVAAINGEENFAKINTSQAQYSLIQAIS